MLPMRSVLLGALLLLPACAVADRAALFDFENPPPELGRPGWVRTTAGTGSWVGALLGGVVSVALLPVTYPIHLLRGDDVPHNGEDLLFPVTMGAATGHFVIGAPVDLLDYTFRRAWVDGPDAPNRFELTPEHGPVQVPPPVDETKPDIGEGATPKKPRDR